MNKKIVFILVIVFSAMFAYAADEVVQSDSLSLVAASSLEAKLTYTHDWRIPMLSGEGPLFEGNNLRVKLSAELSPVSLVAGVEAILTPVALIELNAGASIGSGWNFLGIANGLGLVTELPASYAISEDALAAAVYKIKAGAAFQFDTGALIPGDWSHVIIRSYHEANYRGHTGAAAGQAWEFENNGGTTRNGLTYYGSHVLAYQTPTLARMVGILLETEQSLYGLAGSEAWGEGLTYLNGGPLLNLEFSPAFSLAVLAQWKTVPAYTAATEALYYQNRLLENSKTKLTFNRVAVLASFSL